MNYENVPGRTILRELEKTLPNRPRINGIPGVEAARAIREMLKSLDDSKTEQWEPFQQAIPPDRTNDDEYIAKLAARANMDPELVRQSVRGNAKGEYWRNNLYQVIVFRGELTQLSIKRLDQRAIHDWRHFQWIKNELVGPEFEGVEVYPAESRLVDTANQYYLWVVTEPGYRFPFGFSERMVLDHNPDDTSGAVQRPL